MKKLPPLHHISIIESGSTNCAWVRIRYNGKAFQQSFPFRCYGGKRKAIEAAKKARAKQLAIRKRREMVSANAIQ